MANILLSGPAGAGKSQMLPGLLEENAPAVASDFQSVVVALSQVTRDNAGKFPLTRSFHSAGCRIPQAQSL